MTKSKLLILASFLLTQIANAQWTGTPPIITTTNDVGIGIASPNGKLAINSGWGAVSCAYTGKTALKINWTNPGTLFMCPGGWTGVAPQIVDITADGLTPIFNITKEGSIGIGTAAPTSKLHVLGNSNFVYGSSGLGFQVTNTRLNVTSPTTVIYGAYTSNQTQNPNLMRLYGQSTASNFGDRFVVKNDGQVIIGSVTTPAGYKLFVEQGILTEKLKVAIKTTTAWADYVFAPDYQLMDLTNVEEYIQENKHLPNVPSAQEVVDNGIDMATMDAKLLEKIEELTLYMIQLKKDNADLKARIGILESSKN